MPIRTLAPSAPPEPTPAAPSLSGGGDNDHDDCSALLDLLERFPDLFLKEVLERLDPTARASLAGAGSVLLNVVYPRSIFPCGLPARSETMGGAVRVFKVVDFLGSAERLGWSKANGCPWETRTCSLAARGGHRQALKWMRELGCPSGLVCYVAAQGGHLEVFQWAREHHCPWGESIYMASRRERRQAGLVFQATNECAQRWSETFGGRITTLQNI